MEIGESSFIISDSWVATRIYTPCMLVTYFFYYYVKSRHVHHENALLLVKTM